MTELIIKVIFPNKKTIMIPFTGIFVTDFHPELLKKFSMVWDVVVPGAYWHTRGQIMTITCTDEKNPIKEMLDEVKYDMIPSCLKLKSKDMIKMIMITYSCLAVCDRVMSSGIGPSVTISAMDVLIPVAVEDIFNASTFEKSQKLCEVVMHFIELEKLSDNFTLENVDQLAFFKEYAGLFNIATAPIPSDPDIEKYNLEVKAKQYAEMLIKKIQQKSSTYYPTNDGWQMLIKFSMKFEGNFALASESEFNLKDLEKYKVGGIFNSVATQTVVVETPKVETPVVSAPVPGAAPVEIPKVETVAVEQPTVEDVKASA